MARRRHRKKSGGVGALILLFLLLVSCTAMCGKNSHTESTSSTSQSNAIVSTEKDNLPEDESLNSEEDISVLTDEEIDEEIPTDESANAENDNMSGESELETEPISPSAEKTEPDEPSEVIVYYTDTGSKYHYSSCRTLRDSKYETTLSEAKAMGLEPCGVCHPPV